MKREGGVMGRKSKADRLVEEALQRSIGFDAGNYDAAYVSETMTEELRDRMESKSREYRCGYLVGFYSSFELHEIPNEEDRQEVEALRMTREEWR
jgi:hypothetical protein